MDMDFSAYQRGDFPVDQPMEALKTDHRFVRELFERYFQAQDADEKKGLGRHVLLLLDMHAAIEERVFYPRVREADPSLIDRCEQEHDQATRLIETLRLMDDDDPLAPQLYRQLADAILAHIESEEQELFPKVAQANMDLTAIGNEMQTLEITLIADRMQKPVAPGLRV
ncbi:MAG TPA: hemerythrin domain-containing protein [Noviherbaspirillum sp.]|jgi:hemerythrin superfamily protein|uniref:hemerythrin domain-containing protein n=1 Tax=Noviherbaspirillum sp. TaxID=1926288 RepID=UPI002DDD8171|nr:hemerythrin domain-containing protein [Noviherbaspirillum sp.]HEV2609980.1 hemerythrin domain-containing protein [Noviherbaspirillum sp.]